jgi:polyamine oxidase
MWILNLCLDLYILLATGKQSRPLPEVASIIDGPRMCQKAQVAILGAGVAGITAAVSKKPSHGGLNTDNTSCQQTISAQSIDDFVIVEYNDSIGGRCRSSKFGKHKNGIPYTVEIGANWV